MNETQLTIQGKRAEGREARQGGCDGGGSRVADLVVCEGDQGSGGGSRREKMATMTKKAIQWEDEEERT